MNHKNDEVLKGYLDRQQDIGQSMQKNQKLIGEYEEELTDAADPSVRASHTGKIEKLRTKNGIFQREIDSLDQNIRSRLETLNLIEKSFSSSSSSESQKEAWLDSSDTELLSKITEPLIKEIETRLRDCPSYWESENFSMPEKFKNYTASYFSYVWENISSLRNQLEVPDYQRQRLILEKLLSQVSKISHLVENTMPYQSYDPLTIELSKTEIAIKAVEKDFRKAEFIKLGGSSPPVYLLEAISTKIASLKILIMEIQEQIQVLIDEAYRAMPFIS